MRNALIDADFQPITQAVGIAVVCTHGDQGIAPRVLVRQLGLSDVDARGGQGISLADDPR